jgi:hypothetical protein
VKALQRRSSKEKLKIEIYGPRRAEVNLSHPIQEDTWKKSVHFEGKRRLKVEFSKIRRLEEIVVVDPWETHISRSRASNKNISEKVEV